MAEIMCRIYDVFRLLIFSIKLSVLILVALSIMVSCSKPIDTSNNAPAIVGSYDIVDINPPPGKIISQDIPKDHLAGDVGNNGKAFNAEIPGGSNIQSSQSRTSDKDRGYQTVNLPDGNSGQVSTGGAFSDFSQFSKSNPVFDTSKMSKNWSDLMNVWGNKTTIVHWNNNGVEKFAVHYYQSGEIWSSLEMKQDGVSDTIGQSGCGPSATAVCITNLTHNHQQCNVVEAAYWFMTNNGFQAISGLAGWHSSPGRMAEAYGLYAKNYGDESQRNKMKLIRDYVNGTTCYAVITGSVKTEAERKKSPFTVKGHFVVVVDYIASTNQYVVLNSRSDADEIQFWNLNDLTTYSNPRGFELICSEPDYLP